MVIIGSNPKLHRASYRVVHGLGRTAGWVRLGWAGSRFFIFLMGWVEFGRLLPKLLYFMEIILSQGKDNVDLHSAYSHMPSK